MGLVKAVNRRKKLLDYLKKNNLESYKNVISKLNLNKFHVIVGATDGKPILTSIHVKSFKSDVIIIDIGKGIFKKEALKLAINNNINLYRLDVTPAYNAYLENIKTTQKIHNFNLKRSLIYRKFKLVKRGMLSDENSIIVDNVWIWQF